MLVRELAFSPIKQNLVSAVIRFARDSRAQVIAEGVERADEARVLTALGVHLVQGYYFGVPRSF
jgi:EAL domain-containing protein (putative c-di-GMP-specific phosphodiesterase class I)